MADKEVKNLDIDKIDSSIDEINIDIDFSFNTCTFDSVIDSFNESRSDKYDDY